MVNVKDCAFCDRPNLEWRTIRSEELFTSFVSRPWFRKGHCLVIPNRHVVNPAELSPEESVAIMGELGRLSLKLDKGFGTGMMQKYQPLQAENGIKVNHLHFHVFPRIKNEPGLFPVPQPNTFDGFSVPSDDEVTAIAEALK
jgi:diadenosine tetraphosphate (Ap4A) HIT family hydrolase